MGSQQGAPAAKDAALRADAEAKRWLEDTAAMPDAPLNRVAVALVASLTAARQERDEALGVREGLVSPVQKVIELRDELAAARQREQQLTQALNGYHNLSQAVADCVNECGEQLLYSDLFAANKVAHAVLAGEAPPTAPPVSASAPYPHLEQKEQSR